MKNIRNIALLGASGSGKTTLAEQMLFIGKAINRVGGNMDFDVDEIEKGTSLCISIANLEIKNHLVNIIDTPGIPDFIGDQIAATKAVETMVIVANAAAGYEVGLEKCLEVLEDAKTSTAVIVNKMDVEHADFEKTIEQLYENAGLNAVPIFIPIGKESSFKGIIDIIKRKAFIDNNWTEIPTSESDAVEEAIMKVSESVAETDEVLLDKYLDSGSLSTEELSIGLGKAIASGALVPAFCCAASSNIAVAAVMDAIIDYLPSPVDKSEIEIVNEGASAKFICSPDGELLAYIFKSIVDPSIGDTAYVRVFSGTLKSGLDVFIPEKDNKDKISSMYTFIGKNRSDVNEIKAGEIAGLVKLKVARSMNSIVSLNSKKALPSVTLPSPVFWQAIRAANQNDEDKIGAALTKLLSEDPTMSLTINKETHENVLAAVGELQLSLAHKRLKTRYKVEALLKDPSIPYKETITGKSDVSYKHKKQSGGKGQYGDVSFRVNALERGEGFKFINSIVGGVIPGNFIPAIEKGVHETMEKGILAGCHIVDISVDVYFGSYHDVDSSEMAFKIASSMALKDGFMKANPILLEPIHNVDIIIPTEYMGDVMGDVSSNRRGRIMGTEQKGKKTYLKAIIPLSELFSYYTALKSMTQGRGRFNQEFSHYEKVPEMLAKNVIAAYQASEKE